MIIDSILLDLEFIMISDNCYSMHDDYYVEYVLSSAPDTCYILLMG